MSSVRLDQLTFQQVSSLFKGSKKFGAILPVGCTEQHGPLLPLGCDTALARGASENTAKILADHPHYGAIVLPDFSYTPSPGAEDFSGTISVSFSWMGNGLKEIMAAIVKGPWEFAVIINGHAHNHGRVIEASIAAARGELGRKFPVAAINLYDFIETGHQLGLEPGSHASEFEIALYQYYAGPIEILSSNLDSKNRKTRPPNIFGLDISQRSREGVISEKEPEIKRALDKSNELGRLVDKSIHENLITNLDIYFSQWT